MRAVLTSLAVAPFLLLALTCARGPEPLPADVAGTATPAVASAEPEPAVIYEITEGSGVSFVGSRATAREAGGFHSFEGEIAVVDGDPERSSVRAVIDTTSLWADQPALADHLRSDDFLAVSSFPWASFTSTRVERLPDGRHLLTGNLDLHGVVREISFPATIEIGEDEVTAAAQVTVDRFDFGIDFPGISDDLIAPEVRVDLEIRAARRPAPGDAPPEPAG